MMGFSIIFPLFPETLKFYLHNGNDVVLQVLLQFTDWLSQSTDSKMRVIIFGGVAASIYSILQFIFAPIWGRISDTYGRKKVLIFTTLGGLLGYIVWFFSHSFSLFVLSRIITGSMSGNLSVAFASMADSTTVQDRVKGMGMVGAGIGLGFVFGPPLGGVLSKISIPFASNFTIFAGSALLSILVALSNLLVLVFFFRETLQEKKSKNIDQQIHPILDIIQAKTPGLVLLSWINFLFVFGFSGFEFAVNFFLSEQLLFKPDQIGYTFLYMGLIVIIIQGGVIRRISGKVAEKKIMLAGALCLILGFLSMIVFQTLALYLVALGLVSMGSALLHPTIASAGSQLSNGQDHGKNQGIIRGFGALSRAISPIGFALLYFSFGFDIAFLLSSVLLMLGFVFILKL